MQVKYILQLLYRFRSILWHQKGDMTLTVKDNIPFLYDEAKKRDITIKENNRIKINNDFGLTAAMGLIFSIFQDRLYFDTSIRFINRVFPAFELDGNTSEDFKWKIYNASLGLVLGITAVF